MQGTLLPLTDNTSVTRYVLSHKVRCAVHCLGPWGLEHLGFLGNRIIDFELIEHQFLHPSSFVWDIRNWPATGIGSGATSSRWVSGPIRL